MIITTIAFYNNNKNNKENMLEIFFFLSIVLRNVSCFVKLENG